MTIGLADLVNVGYLVDNVDTAIDFYTRNLGLVLRSGAPPTFADVTRGHLRSLIVEDIDAEAARLRAAAVRCRGDIVTGPGGQQIVFADPSDNPVELFHQAH